MIQQSFNLLKAPQITIMVNILCFQESEHSNHGDTEQVDDQHDVYDQDEADNQSKF